MLRKYLLDHGWAGAAVAAVFVLALACSGGGQQGQTQVVGDTALATNTDSSLGNANGNGNGNGYGDSQGDDDSWKGSDHGGAGGAGGSGFEGFCTTGEAGEAAFGLVPTTEKKNVDFVGWTDLQARGTLQVTAKGDWVFGGHHNGHAVNPLTGKDEWNGTTIIDARNPCKPKITAHIANPENTNCRSVQVMYEFGPKARDYLVRNHESSVFKIEIFDITDRYNPTKVKDITTGPNGKLLKFVHKGWWAESGYYYVAAREEGNGGAYMIIYDLRDPENPKAVSDAMLDEQRGNPASTLTWHHPIVDEDHKRVYGAYLEGGDVVAYDITDRTKPKLLWHGDFDPPYRGTHTITPIYYGDVPGFTPGAASLPRVYALVSDEGTDNLCSNPIRAKVNMMDITEAEETGVPFNIGTWQVPDGYYCYKGGRFGPHQYAETVNGHINRFVDRIAYFAYFNAGFRVVDIANPYDMKEVGYFVPHYNAGSFPIANGQPLSIISNDVDIDYRGLVWLSDRVGGGMHVLKYNGQR